MICADGAAEGPEVREIALRNRKTQYSYLLKVADGCKEETAVLYRNNESAIPVVDLLERNNVPYRIRNAEIGFFTHRTVTDISNIIKLAYDPHASGEYEGGSGRPGGFEDRALHGIRRVSGKCGDQGQ